MFGDHSPTDKDKDKDKDIIIVIVVNARAQKQKGPSAFAEAKNNNFPMCKFILKSSPPAFRLAGAYKPQKTK